VGLELKGVGSLDSQGLAGRRSVSHFSTCQATT
jgi:hypothetical protein